MIRSALEGRRARKETGGAGVGVRMRGGRTAYARTRASTELKPRRRTAAASAARPARKMLVATGSCQLRVACRGAEGRAERAEATTLQLEEKTSCRRQSPQAPPCRRHALRGQQH